MNVSRSSFVAHPDKGKVSAIFALPPNAKAVISLGHGAGAGMEHANMESIAMALYECSIGTFRYQFPFMERGGGRDSNGVSLATVQRAFEETVSLSNVPVLAGGHSFGGRMTSLAAAEGMLPGVAGLVFFSFPLHPANRPSAERAGHLPAIKSPMIFLSGTRDKLFTDELFEPVFRKLGRRGTLHRMETADHGYKILKRTRVSSESVFEEMARVVSGWFDAI